MIKAVFYPLIGAALIAITPFLLTFEKGQDIIHGLVSYSAFVLLLLFNRFKKNKNIAIICVVVLLAISFMDLHNLLLYKNGRPMGWQGILPVVTVIIAIAMQKPVIGLRLRAISCFCFVFFFAHIVGLNFFSQPLMEFPLLKFMAYSGSSYVNRSTIHPNFTSKYLVTDSVTITRDYLDTSRSNVVVLVESWGVPLDTGEFASQLRIFGSSLQTAGIHNRMYSRTRTAEREDLINSVNGPRGHRDTIFIPRLLTSNGISTTFMYGGDSLLHYRNKYIHNIGFENTIYGERKGQNKASICDSVMAVKLDSLLNSAETDSTQKVKRFIAWTTADTQFPLIDDENETNTDSIYDARLQGTLRLIASLAKKHSQVRFIVQGDHNPILSPLEFQNRFYKRWVPFVVLN